MQAFLAFFNDSFMDGASICYCAYVLHISGPVLDIQVSFCAVYDYVEKVGLSKGSQNPKKKIGSTTLFSEIV